MSGLTVVGNFGAANLEGAVDVTLAGLRAKGATDVLVAVIEGDDALDTIRELNPRIDELDCTVSELGDRVVSANAYLGAEPVVAALREGADWVIGGPIGDASLYVGPICAALDCDLSDWNRVAVATLVGHVLECSTQASCGYFADPPYRVVPELWRLGFPYAVVSDGEAVITKLSHTGGLVSEHIVALQVAYEVHDPTAYLTPDVTANFAAVECVELEPDHVRVGGATGTEQSGLVKVMIGVDRGYHAVGEVSYGAAGCVDRAKLAAEIIVHNVDDLGPEVEAVRYDLIGINALVGDDSAASSDSEPAEVRLRVSARIRTRVAAETLTREVERLLLHGPAGGGGSSRSVTPALSAKGTHNPPPSPIPADRQPFVRRGRSGRSGCRPHRRSESTQTAAKKRARAPHYRPPLPTAREEGSKSWQLTMPAAVRSRICARNCGCGARFPFTASAGNHQPDMNGDAHMNRVRTHTRHRGLLVVGAALAMAGTLAAYAFASSPNQGNRLEATYTTSVAVVNNQLAVYGIVQAIATGSGTVEGFGPVTVTTGVTQDRTVTMCGPGSSVDQAATRIVTADGRLILRVSGTRCLDPNGTPIITGTFIVDGAASSGIFAGARGEGDLVNIIGPTSNTVTLSGKLKLAG